jgi:aspartate aminotransferase
MAVSARAKEMIKDGINVINLSAGEPDFPTPGYVKDAGIEAIAGNMTRYTPAGGLEELRILIAEKLKRENGLEFSPGDIVITAGAKQAVFNSAFCLFDDGDEVLIPSPYWVSYPDIVNLAGAKPVIVEGNPQRDFKINVDDLKQRCTSRTRGLILNSPSNPSGAVYSAEELREIGRFCVEQGLWVISDEIYEKIIYENSAFVSIASVCNEMVDKTVIVNGLSKSLSMTGWRIGYSACRPELAKAMVRLQSHTTSCVSSISQYAAISALSSLDERAEVQRKMVSEFDKRRLYLIEHLIDRCGLSVVNPKGAFYLFFDVSPYFGKEADGMKVSCSLSMCKYLLEKGLVALVPGVAFGEDHYIRLSYAASIENIEEGTTRIISALQKLQ